MIVSFISHNMTAMTVAYDLTVSADLFIETMIVLFMIFYHYLVTMVTSKLKCIFMRILNISCTFVIIHSSSSVECFPVVFNPI